MFVPLALFATIVVVFVLASLGSQRNRNIAKRSAPARRRTPARKPPAWTPAGRTRTSRQKSPLTVLREDLRAAHADRRAQCDTIQRAVGAGIPPDERPDDGKVPGHVALVHDLWHGRDFTLRNRAVGLSWLPFVDPPERQETAQTTTARFTRDYELNREEKQALSEIGDDPAGMIAVTAGHIAARIHRYPAWGLSFFDDHSVRVDLGAEVTDITTIARRLHDQRTLLGPPPNGALRDDPQIVGVYLEKARALDRRIAGLMDRVNALNEYRGVVGHIQVRHDKRAWMTRVSAIDDFEHAVDTEVDRHQSDRIRHAASESDLFASVYLETLEPLTASLTLADSTPSPPSGAR